MYVHAGWESAEALLFLEDLIEERLHLGPGLPVRLGAVGERHTEIEGKGVGIRPQA